MSYCVFVGVFFYFASFVVSCVLSLKVVDVPHAAVM